MGYADSIGAVRKRYGKFARRSSGFGMHKSALRARACRSDRRDDGNGSGTVSVPSVVAHHTS